MEERHNWWQLSTIQIGGVICLPVIMIGQALSQKYGFHSAIAAVVVGNAVLLLLGLIAARMSHEKRKTTIETAADFFDARGTKFFAVSMAFSLICWFAIQLNMMSLGVLDLLSMESHRGIWVIFLNTALGALITFVALYGIKGFQYLSNISLPLLLFTLGYAFFTHEPKAAAVRHPFSLGGTSLVIALAIAMVTDLPTYYRHTKEKKDGMVSIFIIFAIVLPLLEVLGIYLAHGNDTGSILDTLKRGEGSLWNAWIALFLILAGWTTNNINLYSASISLQTLIKGSKERQMTILVGALGTFLSYFDLLAHLELTLDIIGVFIAGMGAVMLGSYAIGKWQGMSFSPDAHQNNLCAWGIGIAFGGLSLLGYSLTSIPVLDAVVGGFLGTAAFSLKRGVYEKA